MIEEFVNRDESFREFEIMSRKSEKLNLPLVYFVLGGSGVGKSFFSNVLLGKIKDSFGIKVMVPNSINIPEGYYIEKVSQQLDSGAEKFGYPSFAMFILQDWQIRKNTSLIQHLSKALKEEHIIGKLIDIVENRISPANELELKAKLFHSGISEAQFLHRDYAYYICKNFRISLNIENIHNVDVVSYDFLKELIVCNNENKFILEFTTVEREDQRKALHEFFNRFGDLSGSFQDDFEIGVCFLEKLSKSSFRKIIMNYGIESAFDMLYSNYDGDLRNVKHYKIGLEQNRGIHSNTSSNYRLFHLEHLDNNSKFLLALISVHKGSLPKDQLYFIHESKRTSSLIIDIDEIIKSLIDTHDLVLLNPETKNLVIKHDSTSKTVLESESFLKFRDLSNVTWIDYYESILLKKNFSTITEEGAIILLFHFYTLYSPHKIQEILSRIKNYIFSNIIYPISAKNFLVPIEDSLIPSASNFDKVSLEVAEVYYTLGMYSQARAVLDRIHIETEGYHAFYAACLNRLNFHEDAIEYIQSALVDKPSVRLELLLRSIELTSLKSLNLNEQLTIRYNEIIARESDYNDKEEYGFFLRISQIAVPPHKAEININKSLQYFLNNPVETANSYVTLSIYKTRSGKLREAKELLIKASRFLLNRMTEKHAIQNNLAVVDIYSRHITESTEKNLLNARLTGIGNFNKIVIHNNLLVLYTLTERKIEARQCKQLIENLLQKEPDIALHRTSYYNLSMFHKTFGENMESDDYLNKSILAHNRIRENSIDDIWDAKLCLSDKYDSYFAHLLRDNFYLPTISNWNIPIIIR